MKSYIKSFEKKEIFVERESLHREIRNVLAEQNMQEGERRFYELLEDFYEVVKENDELYHQLLIEKLVPQPNPMEYLEVMRLNTQKATKCLETWEKRVLEQ